MMQDGQSTLFTITHTKNLTLILNGFDDPTTVAPNMTRNRREHHAQSVGQSAGSYFFVDQSGRIDVLPAHAVVAAHVQSVLRGVPWMWQMHYIALFGLF